MKLEYQQSLSEKLLRGNSGSPNKVAPDVMRYQKQFSPWRIQLVILGGIALAEVIAMIFVYYYRQLPYYQQVLLDASIMMIIITPLLYLLSFKPLLVYIQQSARVEKITQARLYLMQYANAHTIDELLQATLDEIEAMTGSSVGFFHFINADQKTLSLQAWSTNTVRNMCGASGKGSHYALDQAGVWADCVRQLQPVVHNDYRSLVHRKGLPDGHAPIIREMAVPIIRNEKIVAILGIGNKPKDFTDDDVELVSTIADFAWDVIEQKMAGIALSTSEEKFRTLVDWTYDWEKWIDPDGNIVYTSPSCERITGYHPEEILEDPSLLIHIIHPDDRDFYQEHLQLVHDESAGIEMVEFRIVAKDGQEHWIEHVCRPLFSVDHKYLGRRISSRDISERKRIEKEIEVRNQKEKALNQRIHNMQINIARDLHDTIGQNISYLRMKLEHISEKCPPGVSDLQQEIAGMALVASESYDLVRGTLAVLQTQTSEDLFYLFKRYAMQVADRAEFEISFTNQGTAQPLSTLQLRQLFYIFREILSNIEKHAQANHVQVELNWTESTLILSVNDDGKGFDPSVVHPTGPHYGLKFMRERVEMLKGMVSINTEIDKGSQILVHVPYALEEIPA